MLKKILYSFLTFNATNMNYETIKNHMENINYYLNTIEENKEHLLENEIQIIKNFYTNIIKKLNFQLILLESKFNSSKYKKNMEKILEIDRENKKINKEILIKYCWALNENKIKIKEDSKVVLKYTLNNFNQLNRIININENQNKFDKTNKILEIFTEHYFNIKDD